MQALAMTMSTVESKHKYGYLKKPVKRQVDKIVDVLENFPIVSECYDRWLELQNQVDSYYKDERRARLKLSEQKEFRAIKNAVIAVADQINAGTLMFEDERMRDEPDEFPQASSAYHRLREAITDMETPLAVRDDCVEELTQLAEDGDRCAQYFLGKLYRDGGLLTPDDEQAEEWFRRAAENGLDCAAYALGKLCLDGTLVQQNVALSMAYMERAAQHGNAYAQLFVDRQDSLKPSSVILSVTRLFRSMGQVFRDNSLPQSGEMQTGLDRKRMQELIEQKGYEAARSYAREYQPEQEYSGMSMATPW